MTQEGKEQKMSHQATKENWFSHVDICQNRSEQKQQKSPLNNTKVQKNKKILNLYALNKITQKTYKTKIDRTNKNRGIQHQSGRL